MSKGEETKQKIVNSAILLFSTKGYDQTSIRDIAQQVNIKAPSIYAYFSSKEELFEQVLNFVMNDYQQFIHSQANAIHHLSVKEQLYTLLHVLNDYFYEYELGHFISRYVMLSPEQFKETVIQKYQQSEEEIKDLLRSILTTESEKYIDTDIIIMSFLCMLDGMLFYMINFSQAEYEKRLKASWEVFWKGILQ
ncbi:TetR/AcrR family transcriptional regulator [Lysinibacillus piscis]|nr:TetR/AcrR family transcriptional regulator [Lysinibacillus sp. KH24]